MNKQLKIQCCKCLLVLGETQLFQGLKPEILVEALKKGKAYKRVAANERRQAQIDRWQLYELLKGNQLTEDCIQLVETMAVQELREGVIEFLSSLKAKGSEK